MKQLLAALVALKLAEQVDPKWSWGVAAQESVKISCASTTYVHLGVLSKAKHMVSPAPSTLRHSQFSVHMIRSQLCSQH